MALLLGTILFSVQGTAFAQPELSEAPEDKGDTVQPADIDLRLYITSQIDTLIDPSNAPTGTKAFAKELYRKYFNDARTETLKFVVSRTMEKVLNARLEDFRLRAEITSNPNSAKKFEASPNSYKVENSFWPASDGSFYIRASVARLWSGEPIFSSSYQILYKDDALLDPNGWDLLELGKHPELDADIKRILQELASALVSRIDDEVIQWFVESSIKLSVAVLPFKAAGSDTTLCYLEKGLKAMVETELSRSEAIMIYADEYPRSQGTLEDSTDRLVRKTPTPKPNYEVHGSFFPIGNNLRIDLRCIKTRTKRILTSSKVAIDTLSVDRLSSRIAEASHRLKSAMLSDFRRSTKTLAIVAEPPIKYFSAGELSKESKHVAKLIVHSMINKFQLLMAHAKKLDQGTNLKIYYCNSETIDGYIKDFPNPADIINDLDIDYLVLVRTEDLGHRIRLSANFHSYDLERPGLAEYIHQEEGIKSRVESVIDTTVLQMSQKLCEKGILKAVRFCSLFVHEKSDTLQKVKSDSLKKILKKVRVIDFQRNKGAGIRAGATKHIDRELYLGKESTEYYEIFFSLLLPSSLPLVDWRLPYWLSHELEASVGYDLGAGNIFRKGVVSANGFINYKLVFTWLQHASFPILFSCGGGPGVIGMSFRYDEGDGPYTGDKAYKRGILRFAGNAFGGIELPLSDKLRLQGVVRYIFGTPEIKDYADFQFDKSVSKPPIGSLNGLFFVGGIKYIWR